MPICTVKSPVVGSLFHPVTGEEEPFQDAILSDGSGPDVPFRLLLGNGYPYRPGAYYIPMSRIEFDYRGSYGYLDRSNVCQFAK